MKPLSGLPDRMSMFQAAPAGQAAGRDGLYTDNSRQVGELANLEEYLNGNNGGDPLQADLFQDLLSPGFVPDNTFCAALSTAVRSIISIVVTLGCSRTCACMLV